MENDSKITQIKFVADEGVDRSLVRLLREEGFEVLYFGEVDQSSEDEVVLKIANEENRILLTRDKDFGELVYRLNRVHSGIILIRLEALTSIVRSKTAFDFIIMNLDQLQGHFIVLQPGMNRVKHL